MPRIKIIGLGNTFMGDDAVGVEVARQLRPYSNASIDVIEAGMAGLSLLHEMEDTDKLILIDAVQSQSEAGSIFRFRLPDELDRLNTLTWQSSLNSTHAIGLQEALQLAITLDVLPLVTILYGIELGHLEKGRSFSQPVLHSISTLVNKITIEELQDLTCMSSS